MIIYNVTVNVEDDVEKEWLNWMKTHHIPRVMSCGIFLKAHVSKVITHNENTYAISYFCKNVKDLHRYQIQFSQSIQEEHANKYAEKAVVFRTILELIEEF